ncbi:iron complex outermembrane recepter protein [Alteromonadaceae bacterium Bs31]|nr:iron complex outermembrane recepter protein [Alteromonadaceae bacterium Bs31]
MHNKYLTLPICFLCSASFASDLPIEVVDVIGRGNPTTNEELSSQQALSRPVHDAGELLRSVNGMTATRRGGRGFEPIIRGQSQNQLNIMTDGAYTFGACPGRMDPPTTYTALENFDSLTIIKGHRSVIYGAGGSGGTLLFEHRRPDLKEKSVLGSVNLGHTTNSELSSASANLVLGNEKAFARLFGDISSSDNYEDGDGNKTASAYDSNSHGIIAGADINANHYLQFSYEGVSEDDVWFAGNGMDSPWTDSKTYRLKWQYQGQALIDNFEFTLYQSDVDHLMDNYTVRERMPMNPNGAAAPSQSETQGGRWLATIENPAQVWRFGLDHRANERNAELYMDMGKNGSYDMLMSIMWPGVEQANTGIFAELDRQAGSKDLLRFGLRLDQFSSDATRADQTAGMMGSATPNTLYQNAYGASAQARDNNHLSAVLGWDRTLSKDLLFSTNLSRSVRAPDAAEQYIARSAQGRTWVGRPDIASEVHHQLDLSLLKKKEQQSWSATVFWDEVSDYIERFNQDSATLYRNISAQLYGMELDGQYSFGEHWNSSAALSYLRGKGDNGDLGQISPLEARLSLDYQLSKWRMGAEIVAAAEQDNFDPSNDAGPSDSFGILNLYAHWTPTKAFRLQGGIENLFNESYAYHVNTANSDPFNPDPVRVNEPGQQLWVKARYQF